jgi:DNA-binding GntR family transcriptional regulator
MSGFEHPQPTEIRQYVQVASWLREQIVGGRITLGSKLHNAAITVLRVHE